MMVMEQTNFMVTMVAILASSLVNIMAATATDINTDQSALLALKLSVSLDPVGILTKNWTMAASVCEWAGVTCAIRHNRVSALNISYMNLEGTIPPQLGNLSFLVSFDANGNRFTGNIPEELGNLRRLRVLILSDNLFTGNIPPTLGLLSQLKFLSLLNNNGFTGLIPSSIFNLSRLESFLVSSNGLQGELPEPDKVVPNMRYLAIVGTQLQGSINENLCRSFPNLKQLFLYQSRLTGPLPKTLQDCSLLETLSIWENNFTGSIPRWLGNLTQLVGLDIHNNSFTGEIPQELEKLQHLDQLILGSNSLTGRIPSGIFNISTLTTLDFAINQLWGNLPATLGYTLPNLVEIKLHVNSLTGQIPASITNCSKLEALILNHNKFSGPIPNNLGDLRQLKRLFLTENNLTIDSSSQELSFITSLTNCRDLVDLQVGVNPLSGILPSSIGNLSSSLLNLYAPLCNIRGSIPQEVGNLSSLIILNMFGNQLTGPIPQTVRKMQDLQALVLRENKINGLIPTSLCQLKNLGGLDLDDNRISGTIPSCLSNVASLRYIYISSNRLSNSIPSSFWKLKELLQLTLSGNYLSGILSPEIGNLTALLALDLSNNRFSGYIPNTFGGFVELTDLSLAHNSFEGSIPDVIGSMVSLETLNLSHNNLSGQIPKSLEKLQDLTSLDVSSNRLSGPIPSEGPFKILSSGSFMFNEGLCGPSMYNVSLCHANSAHSSWKKPYLLAVFISTVTSVAIIGIIITIFLRRSRSKHAVSNLDDPLRSLMPGKFSYYGLQRATGGYSETNLLGSGSYGSVYKGVLDDGTPIAVKIFHLQMEGAFKSFDTECEAFRNLRHRNIAKVISSCSNTEFRALVMEYMPKGSLEKWLYSHNDCLDIRQRLNIVIDVACALEYLHHGTSLPVVHCDIKPSNVLLDADMVAHLSDFGVAKLFSKGNSAVNTKTFATLGYIAPEYGMEGLVSTKCDVYSFEIMIMELFTRVKPNDDAVLGDMSLKSWVNASMISATVHKVIDAKLKRPPEIFLEKKLQCISTVLDLALRCSAESPRERLTMTEVLPSLNRIKVQFSAYMKSNVEH